MFCSEDFWILKDKILEFGQANYDLKESELVATASLVNQGYKSLCYDLISDIFKRLDKLQSEYTDMLYDLSDQVPDSDSYYGFDSDSDK